MKTSLHLLRGLLLAGLAAGLTGCIVITIKSGKHHHEHESEVSGCCGAQEREQSPAEEPPRSSRDGTRGGPSFTPGDPAGNFGTVNMHTGVILTNKINTGCFRANQGWNRYFVLPGYFAGPNTPPLPGLPNFTNTNNSVTIRVQTCNLSNVFWGTTLQTGIILQRDDAPNQYFKCRTNALQCAFSTTLTTNTYNMLESYYYRATIYYKSTSLPSGQTNISVNWNYE